jgi:hypothetical protein
MNPLAELTAARMLVIVPGTLFWLVKETIVGELDEFVPVYALPFPLNEIATELAAICANVIGEPLGVQILPMAFELQPASVPVPGLRFCKSNLISPDTVPRNSDQSVMLGVNVGDPTRLPCTTEDTFA